MDEVIVFILNSVVQVIISLRQIMIPGFNVSLLSLIIGFMILNIIVTFLLTFFTIEQSRTRFRIYNNWRNTINSYKFKRSLKSHQNNITKR